MANLKPQIPLMSEGDYIYPLTTIDQVLMEDGSKASAKNPIADMIYPVGSIYMSVNNVSPTTLFGGTWEQLKDRFLLGAGSAYTAGAIGGEATHTLTVDEMPSHAHNMTINGTYSTKDAGTAFDRVVFGNSWLHGAKATESTGGGAAHNNMPPYLVVYMWKRTA